MKARGEAARNPKLVRQLQRSLGGREYYLNCERLNRAALSRLAAVDVH
jgi:hypothetical protein